MLQRIIKGGLLSFAMLTGLASANAQFTLEGQYRPRLEVRNGFKKPITPGQEAAAFVEHRARLTAGYKKDKLGFKMSIQDVRVFGDVGQINKSDQSLSVHEAYGDFYASSKSTFRVGRQEWSYDGNRFIGTLDWAAQARSFDAITYMYKDTTGNEFNIGLTFNQNGEGAGITEPQNLTGTVYNSPAGPNANTVFNLPMPKSQQLAYYKKTLSSADVSFMLLNDIYETGASAVPYSQTHLGLTGNFKPGALKVGAQAYYSLGSAGNGFDANGDLQKVSLGGYMFHAYVQAPKVTGAPLLGFDYISGDDASTTDKVEGWAPLYGTNHAFNGFMDYFYVGNGHGGGNNNSAGLLDIYLKTKFKVGEKSALLGHVHYFASTAERFDATGKGYQGTLGAELDIVYVNKLAEGVTLKAGYSQMFGISETMKVIKGMTPDAEIKGMQNWAWVMIDFTPKFLN